MNDANAEIYERYAQELIRFATGLVGPSDASDVVAGAVLTCFYSKHWPTVRDRRAYLYRGVLNEARQMRRSDSRRRIREERSAQSELIESPESSPEVTAALSHLSLRQRAVIVLTYWADLSPEAIATLLEISPGTVHRHLARARSRLRESLHVTV